MRPFYIQALNDKQCFCWAILHKLAETADAVRV